MPNNKKKRVTRKQQKQVQLNSEKSVHLNNINLFDKLTKNGDLSFKPGDIVKLKNLQTSPELNGKFTVVTKNMLENGRIPVMVNGPNPFALRQENLEVFHECPNKNHETSKGAMVWPSISKQPTPTIKWLDDIDDIGVTIVKCPNWVAKNKECFYCGREEYKRSEHDPCLKIGMAPETLKENFGWQKPGYVRMAHSGFHIFFDAESKGPINTWLDHPGRFARKILNGFEIRGPFIFFQPEANNQFPGYAKLSSINGYKIFLYLTKHQVPKLQSSLDNSEEFHENSQKIHDKMMDRREQVTTNLAKDKANHCPDILSCTLCKGVKSTYARKDASFNVKKFPSLENNRGNRIIMDKVHRIWYHCNQHNFSIDDFWTTYYKHAENGKLFGENKKEDQHFYAYARREYSKIKANGKIIPDKTFQKILDEAVNPYCFDPNKDMQGKCYGISKIDTTRNPGDFEYPQDQTVESLPGCAFITKQEVLDEIDRLKLDEKSESCN